MDRERRSPRAPRRLPARPALVSDGAGGGILTWQDERVASANPNIFAQRLDNTGTPQWGVNGTASVQRRRPQQRPRHHVGRHGRRDHLLDRPARILPAPAMLRPAGQRHRNAAVRPPTGVNVLAKQFGRRVSEVVAAPSNNAIVLANQLIFDFLNGTRHELLWWRKRSTAWALRSGASGRPRCARPRQLHACSSAWCRTASAARSSDGAIRATARSTSSRRGSTRRTDAGSVAQRTAPGVQRGELPAARLVDARLRTAIRSTCGPISAADCPTSTRSS